MKNHSRPLIFLAILVVLPWVVKLDLFQGIPVIWPIVAMLRSDYFMHLMILVLMWVTIGSGWNIIAGYTGQVSFGDAAFFGAGAYTAGLLFTKLGISPWWGLALGGFAAVLIAFPFGWICFRLRGAYFALATLALNEILRHIATIWESFTNGMEGIQFFPTFVSKMPYYYVALAIAALSIIVVELVIRSRWGYYFVSIREDQDAAESFGIDTLRYKMISLCLAAFLTGMAGSLYMNYQGFIDPEVVFSLHDISIMAILVGIVGGVSTVYGPMVGAFIMVAVSESFRTGGFGMLDGLTKICGASETEFIASYVFPALQIFTQYVKEAHVLSFGLLVVLVILFLPNGVVGDWGRITHAFSFRRKGSA